MQRKPSLPRRVAGPPHGSADDGPVESRAPVCLRDLDWAADRQARRAHTGFGFSVSTMSCAGSLRVRRFILFLLQSIVVSIALRTPLDHPWTASNSYCILNKYSGYLLFQARSPRYRSRASPCMCRPSWYVHASASDNLVTMVTCNGGSRSTNFKLYYLYRAHCGSPQSRLDGERWS